VCLISRLFSKPYNAFAIKPTGLGLGLGSDCVQMQTDAGTSSTVISMEVQVAHTFLGKHVLQLVAVLWWCDSLQREKFYYMLGPFLCVQSWTLGSSKKDSRDPITGLDRPLGFQEVEARRISRKSVHEGVPHRPLLPPRRDCLCPFLLEAVSTPGPRYGRKDKKKIQITQSGIETSTFRLVTPSLRIQWKCFLQRMLGPDSRGVWSLTSAVRKIPDGGVMLKTSLLVVGHTRMCSFFCRYSLMILVHGVVVVDGCHSYHNHCSCRYLWQVSYTIASYTSTIRHFCCNLRISCH
jgi:hypothetical protein